MKAMEVFERIRDKKDFLAIVGLGYVGLPLAVAFAEKVKTLGFDINQEKVDLYNKGIDPTGEVGNGKIQNANLELTTNPARLKEAKVIIVTVPTPITRNNRPDLTPIISASEIIGKNLTKESIVVYESTVYPGVTEEICLPILEKESGLVCGQDFKIGYSPERVNPGDKVNRLQNITKIVSGIDEETTEALAAIYGLVVIYSCVNKVCSIKVAESAKLAENAQRDINIAFMNELAMFFSLIDINSKDVIEAMNTKWNALGFYPGLVGGHCIGIDPYYFIYKAEMLGYHSQIIFAGRKINEHMGRFVTDNVIKKLIEADVSIKKCNIYVMGITFKENCPDMRNSKSFDVCRQLSAYGINVKVVDPVVDEMEFKKECDFDLVNLKDVKDADCLVFLVRHKQFDDLRQEDLGIMFRRQGPRTKPVVIDIKNIFDSKNMSEKGYTYWSF